MGLNINLGGGGRRKRWQLELSALPVEASQTGSRLGGVLLILFAVVWGGFPTVGLLSMLRSGELGGEAVIFLVFPLVGIGILLFGIHIFLWRRSVAFDGQTFTVTERGLTGERSWSEPLSAYDGVLRSTRQVRTKNSSYTLYMVDLIHPVPDRKINLYTDTREAGFRTKWEEYARLLNLPAFEQGDGEVVRREAADLDKSVGDLIREGKVEVNYNSLAHPADGVAVDIEGDTIVITRTGPKNPWWGSLFAVLFPLIFVGVGLFAPDLDLLGRVIFSGVGTLFEILFVIGVYSDLTSRGRLRIGPDGIRMSKLKASGEDRGDFIPADEIESIHVGKKQGEWRPSIVMASDRKTLRFGAGLPRTSLDFLSNTVLAKIAETERRRGRR